MTLSKYSDSDLRKELRRRKQRRDRGGHYRGEDIPPVSDYAHWNEDARYMWYMENRYDMEHADEWIEDEW